MQAITSVEGHLRLIDLSDPVDVGNKPTHVIQCVSRTNPQESSIVTELEWPMARLVICATPQSYLHAMISRTLFRPSSTSSASLQRQRSSR